MLETGLARAQVGTRLEQASNGTPDAPISAVDWVTTAITAQRGHFVEGSSVPYRLVFESLLTGAHRVVIAWDTRTNGRHAIDYLTHFNRLQPHNQFGAHTVPETIQPLRDISGGPDGPLTFPIPAPSQPGSSFHAVPANQRMFHIYNGTITAAAYVGEGDLSSASTESRIAIDFVANDFPVLILFGGHLATKEEWGVGQTAAGVPGLAYRMRLVELDGLPSLSSLAVNAPAVVSSPSCGISGPDPVCPRTTNTYTASTDVPGASFSWSFTENSSGASIVGPSIGPTVEVRSGTGGGVYSLQVAITQGPLHSLCARRVTVLTETTAIPMPNVNACPGNAAAFNAEPRGTGPFSFLWRKGAEVLAGETKNRLVLSNVTTAAAGLYCVEITGACNSVTNCASLTVHTNTTATALQNLGRCLGDSAVFATTASGAGPFAYRWRKNGTELPGQTNRIFTIAAVTFTDAGTYTVEVNGLCNSITNQATLMVYGLPPCTLQGTNTVCPMSGGNVYTGPPGMGAYRWRVTGNGSIIGPTNQPGVVVAATGPGFLTLMLTVSNANGCSRTCSRTITVGDIQPPAIACPENISTNTQPGQCSSPVEFVVTAADNCDGATVVCNPPSGAPFPTGTTTVNCTASDNAGNQASCAFDVSVLDLEKPTLIWPTNMVANTGPELCGAVVNYTVTVADNCPGTSLICSPPSGTTFPVGTSGVTCRASDAAGNIEFCAFDVTVLDDQPPQLACPGDLFYLSDPAQCDLVVDYDVQAGDNCGPAMLVCVPPSGALFPQGITLVVCAATDASTNQAVCSFRITVDDGERPRVVCPGDISVNTEPGRCDAVMNYTVKVNDNCPDVTITCIPSPGTRFQVGQTDVTCTATDASGSTATCTFKVTVTDNERPILTCASDLVVNTETGRCDAVVTYAAGVTDNCPGATLICLPPSGSVLSVGATLVSCSAIDANSNSVSCAFHVWVQDSELPLIICPPDITTNSAPGLCGALVQYQASATDTCAGVEFFCDPPSGSFFPVGHNFAYCVAIDVSGNAQECGFHITVNDVEPPLLTCPADFTINAEPNRCDAVAAFAASATDNCAALPVTCIPPSGARLPAGVTSVTCRTEDTSGNVANCTFRITVRDSQPPVVSCASNWVAHAAPGRCDAVVNFTANVTDNCPGATLACVPPSGTTFVVGTNLVTCGATDTSGNQAQCVFTVTVSDQEPPVITCPADRVVATAPGRCDAVASFAASVTDNCAGATLACNPPSGSVFVKGTNVVNCAATDAGGNTAACAFRVIVQDREAPALACPANIITNTAPGRCDSIVNFAPAVGDNCPTVAVACVPPSGFAFAAGLTTVNCVATDSSGNTNRCSFFVAVSDDEPPLLACPANIVTTTDTGQCDARVTFSANASDNCTLISNVCAPPSGTRFAKGNTPVTCTARDNSGNEESCSFTITVNDNQPPALVCPTNQIVMAEGGRCDAVASFAPNFSDNCAGTTLACVPPSGARFAIGQTAVTCTATDASGNTNRCTFLVTVNDLERPEVLCPADIVAATEAGRCDAAVSFSASATDNCPGTVVACIPPSGSRFNRGATVVACTATDARANSAACAFTVTVNDLEPPQVVCSSNIIANAANGRCDASVGYVASVTDNCPGATLLCEPASGANFPVGVTPVNCVGRDASGNTNRCSFSVTVMDRQKPVITCPLSQELFTGAGQCDAPATFTPTVTDNCPGAGVACVPPSGSRFVTGVSTVTCTATDASGNTENCSFTVTVRDVEAPVLVCPTNIIAATDAGRCDAVISFAPGVADDCAGVTLVCVPPSGARFPRGTTLVGCTATDASGNAVSCGFNVQIQDREAPTLVCPANLVTNADSGWCDAVVDFAATLTDNCPGGQVVCEPPSGWVFPIGTNIVTCIGTDGSGNQDNCAFSVIIVDNQKPMIVCAGNLSANTEPGRCDARVAFAPDILDNCDGATAICDPPSGSPFLKGATLVHCTATDASGNTERCSFTVTVSDNEPPAIACPPNLMLETGPSLCSARADFSVQVTDNCAGASVQCVPPSGSEFPVGITAVVCQAADAAGNTRSCGFDVRVTDTEPPRFICPGDLTFNTDSNQCTARVSYAVSAEDACGLTNFICTPPPGSLFAKGVTAVQCTASDASGNEAACAFNITIRDAQRPTLFCPTNMVVPADHGRCNASVTFGPGYSDNCPGASVSCIPPSGFTFPLGTTPVNCTATDAAGNTNQCAFTVRVIDTEKPVVLCSGNLAVNTEVNRCDAVVTYSTSASDNCGTPTPFCNPPSGSRFALGVTSVSCTASDSAGNVGNCNFTVSVRDLQSPLLQCSSNLVVSANPGRCDAAVNFNVSGTDNCGGVGISCIPPSASFFPVGATTVNCTAVDGSSNVGQCAFSVEVRDVEPPTLQCPADIAVNCATNRCDAVVSFAATASDNCPGVNVTCVPPSGATFLKGTNVVTCTARDAGSNSVNCTFKVIVRDVEKPRITCPGDMVVSTEAVQCRVRVTFSTSFADNCPGTTVICNPPSTSWFDKGVTAVSCIATDTSGNTNRCSFNVTVNDTVPPTIICPPNISTNAAPGQLSTPVEFAAAISDNCPGTSYVCSPPSGSIFSQGTTPVTCTATDASGNVRSCSFTVAINDNEPPVIHCPTNLTITTSLGRCDAIANFTVTATDNSQGVTVTCTPPSRAVLPKGLTNVLCTATDAASNRVSCAFTINVIDLERPVITCPTNLVMSTEPSRCDAQVKYTATATDNCGAASLACNPPSNTVLPKGTNTVTCSATDSSGNLETCSFVVIVVDPERPSIDCPANITVVAQPGQCDAPVSYQAAVTDNCPGATLLCVPPSGASFTKGVTQVNCTGRDTSGNASACSFQVQVRDLEAPVIACPADIDTTTYPGLCTAAIFYGASVSDNCPGAMVSCNPPSGVHMAVGTNVVSCTGIDTSGNTDSCTFRVIIRDIERPVLICPGDIVLDGSTGNCSPVATYNPTVQDSCPGATMSCVPPSGTSFPQGTNRVQCVGFDRAGNSAGCAFNVIVRLQPVSATPLQSQVVCANDPVTFATTASGSGPLTFTWTRDNNVIPGQTSASLTLPKVTIADAGIYTVTVRGSCNSVTNSATLAVNLPVVIAGLTNVTRCDCDPLVLSPVVSGTGPLSYLWRKNGSIIPGAVEGTLSFAKLGTNDAGVYSVEVSGACNTASRSASIAVIKVPNPAVYTNSGAIIINDHAPAFPYPSSVRVSCVPQPITRATVTLRGLTHAYPDDVDVLLAGPDGQSVMLMSDAGDGSFANNVNLTLDDSATGTLPDNAQLFSGVFRPGNYEDTLDAFPLPAPKLPHASELAALAGNNANGFWSLFVVDDFQLDGGSINNGWVLRLYWESTPIRLGAPRRLADGRCQMTLTGDPQTTCTIEASTDLQTWIPIATIILSAPQTDFTDPTPGSLRFYRATQP